MRKMGRLNRSQAQVLAVALLLVALLGLIPPWEMGPPSSSWSHPLGHHFLFSPPPAVDLSNEIEIIERLPVRVDLGTLLLYWSAVGAVTGPLLLGLKGWD